ncbi:MAG: hypothetical protein IJY71_06865, partial [Clostridia bacterium]|nr:hypothetical protein [Clostridia bacterium]
ERYSKPLKNWQSFSRKVLLPFKKWLKDFAAFFNETSYKQIWILLWVLYFNIPAIVVDFFAYYLYFVPSFDVASLYGQLLKLTVDLAPMVRFIPVLGWIVIGFVALNAFCRNQAFDTLDHCERKNAGFINERGVVTIVYGKMGVGKTALLTSMALTEEANMRRMALEVLLENDIKFPHFPWDRLRAEIKQRLEDRRIVDARYSVESWLRPLRQKFEWFAKHPESAKWLHRNAVKRNFFDCSFGYDFDLYPTTYNDELSLTKLYDAIEDYTKAYVVYAVDTSLILANYSIRTDALREELNYFPVWNHDFFARDVRLQEAHSRYCHILDFDMLRLGKRMKENNVNRNAFGFGVYVVSEIDKERKNQNDLKEMKVKEETCNQRNDLFNSCLKMSRHACVIGNRVFLKIFCDLQRPEDWGAGGREVGEVVFIDEKGPLAPVLPFFSPFWLCEGIYKVGKKIYDKICVKHLFPTFEKTLTAHALKSFFAKLDNHYTKVNNLFGCQVLNLKLESGTLDGPVKECKYYRMPKKDFSKRYSTNCLSAIFDGAEPNTVSIADLPCYASIMANNAELAMQNSHFQRDISSMKSA